MEKVVTLINPLEGCMGAEPVSTATTSRGKTAIFQNGDYTTNDAGEARDLQERYPYLLDAPREVIHPTHPMYVGTIGVPWGKYDELGRRLPDDVDTKSSA